MSDGGLLLYPCRDCGTLTTAKFCCTHCVHGTARRTKVGVLFRLGSFWIGWHWSPYNKRLCVNLVPCITVWVTLPGGNTP